MGNSYCFESREKFKVHSEPSITKSKVIQKEDQLVLQVNKQCLSQPTKAINASNNDPIDPQIDGASKATKLTNQTNNGSMLLNRIKNITSYKPKQSRPSFHLTTNLINSKLVYSSFTCDKTPSNNPSKIENKSLTLQIKEAFNLRTRKSTNEILGYISAIYWKNIIDYLSNNELVEARRSCVFFNRIACSPLILKKFFFVQTPSEQVSSLKTGISNFKLDFSNITSLMKRRSNLKGDTPSKTNSESNTFSKKGLQSLEIIESVRESNITVGDNHKPSINEDKEKLEGKDEHEVKLHINKISITTQLYDSMKLNCNQSSSCNNNSKLLSVSSKLVESMTKNSADKFSGSISDISCGNYQQLTNTNRTNLQEINTNALSSTNLICMLTPISNISPRELSRIEAKSLNDSFMNINARESVSLDKG